MTIAERDPRVRAKVLVVDDLYANRVAMRQVLRGIDTDIVEAASGNEALAACLDHEFALILLDVQMPGMDGVEVAQWLNGDEHTRETPIIFVTAGSTDDMDRLKGYDVGAVDYITKPVNPALLSAKVRSFLELYRSRQALKQAMHELDRANQRLREEIEERKHAEARARQLATHDALTGLPNRLLFFDRLEASQRRAERAGHGFVLGYLDLDGFKPINDAYGHHAGDQVLKTVAGRLHEVLRESDTSARLGGDEFAMILEDVIDVAGCVARCRYLRDVLGAPIELSLQGRLQTVSVGVSIGLAVWDRHTRDTEALMHEADSALYVVKSQGKGDVHVFNPETDERAVRR